MGGKYQVRTYEETFFSNYTDYYVDSFWRYIKLRMQKRGQVIFVTKRFS